MKNIGNSILNYTAGSLYTYTPIDKEIKLNQWVTENKKELEEVLLQRGGLLFRNFPKASISEFSEITQIFSSELLEYKERSTPRTEVQDNIYTSTEYPKDQCIPMHNESSYSKVWPMKIWFSCQINAEVGGETPIADSRELLQKLDASIKKQFIEKKVMYVRNFDGILDLSWQNVFQTEDQKIVEQYCQKNGIAFEWISKDHLRTRTVRDSVAIHPLTKEKVWFNQANLFHVSSLPLEAREWLIEERGYDNLPRNTYFGDGSKIPDSLIDEIQGLYEEISIVFPWQEGDVLMLDNMLMAHGRKTFKGDRKIVVAMAEPYNV
ncbi:TauD/TfdA family dioxygenase [Paenibacillus sp. UMB7766-LJ446]|uniref:TauD/TfdA family dioxygenase n=1 Tax=Paenibacillus sp. UMB7766-LJ446 TaxID=3046313 RepID=UPI00254D48E6|nr:TauD/TfdA family dioxygenase [Paenibacillus sp. UMB7766-LJ446]MDK8191945.1 TauD/TfdA family dioxygenase [Paenibacillus sp. UMB7766-LJ446]